MGNAAGLYAAGGAVGAGASLAQARAQQNAANYNAAIARRNARIAKEQSKRDAVLVREQGFRALGSIKAGVGASGVTMEGSFQDVLTESARNIKRDELNVLYQGELRAMGYEAEARMQTYSGKVARQMGYYGAASSLLSGGARAYGASDLGSPSSPPTQSPSSGMTYNYQPSGGQRYA